MQVINGGALLNLLIASIIIFVILEMANVCILYFTPNSRRGNGVAVFNHWESSKDDENAHLFARYMVNWVAGTKLIFIGLLIVILLTGDELTLQLSGGVLILSITTYFWRLHPIVKLLDQKGLITPRGYSKTLGLTIVCFIVMLSLSLLFHLVF